MEPITIPIKQLPHGETLPLPAYATKQSAGIDLMAALNDIPITLNPIQRVLIPTGIAIALPDHFEAQIRPRSGLAAKHGITVLNTPGTIDSDYRGEIKVILINLSEQPFTITHGMKIAQMIFAPYAHGQWQLKQTLPETHRNKGGFGSTGL